MKETAVAHTACIHLMTSEGWRLKGELRRLRSSPKFYAGRYFTRRAKVSLDGFIRGANSAALGSFSTPRQMVLLGSCGDFASCETRTRAFTPGTMLLSPLRRLETFAVCLFCVGGFAGAKTHQNDSSNKCQQPHSPVGKWVLYI